MGITEMSRLLEATVYLDIISKLSLQAMMKHQLDFADQMLDVALHVGNAAQVGLAVLSDDGMCRIERQIIVGGNESVISSRRAFTLVDQHQRELEDRGYITLLGSDYANIGPYWGVLIIPIYVDSKLVGLLEYVRSVEFTGSGQVIDFLRAVASLAIAYLQRLAVEQQLRDAQVSLNFAVGIATRSIQTTAKGMGLRANGITR